MTTPPEQPFDPRDIPYGTYFLGLVIVGAIAALTFIAPLRHSVFATFGINVLPSFVCGTSQVADADGNAYDTVLIGTQCWMAQNLNVGTRVGISTTQTDNATIEKWCYDDTDANCDSNVQAGHNHPDGGLYQWEEAMQYSATEGAQGICPSGWHIPTDAEWYTLESYLATGSCSASRTGYDCDPAGTLLKPNGSSGFEGNLAGLGFSGSFGNRGSFGYFWSSSESGTAAWFRNLGSSEARVNRAANVQSLGFSVRCVKDDPNPTNPTVTISTTPSIPELDQGLVGHWTFDGPDVDWGSTTAEIRDRSDAGHNADARGTLSTHSAEAGIMGQALAFDGVSDHIYIPSPQYDSPTASWAAWINADIIDSYDTIFDMSADARFIMRSGSGFLHEGRVYARIYTNQGFVTIEIDSPIEANRWYHVAATYDKQDLKLYVNGVLEISAPTTTDLGVAESWREAYVGRSWIPGSSYWPGRMDDVRIYNRALSADEVQRLYRLGEGTKISTTIKTPGSPLEQGLVGHWTFDGPDVDWGSTTAEIKDVSGNGNHGDAQGGMNTRSVTPGRLGQGMSFDGVDDYVNAGADASHTNLTTITIAAWVSARNQNVWLTEKPYGWVLGLESTCNGKTNTLAFSYFRWIDSNGVWCVDVSDSIPDSGWVHVAATYDAGLSTNDPVLYVNGTSMAIHELLSPAGSLGADSGYQLRHGGRSGKWLEGSLDDVRVYNRTLSAQEVQMLYQLGR